MTAVFVSKQEDEDAEFSPAVWVLFKQELNDIKGPVHFMHSELMLTVKCGCPGGNGRLAACPWVVSSDVEHESRTEQRLKHDPDSGSAERYDSPSAHPSVHHIVRVGMHRGGFFWRLDRPSPEEGAYIAIRMAAGPASARLVDFIIALRAAVARDPVSHISTSHLNRNTPLSNRQERVSCGGGFGYQRRMSCATFAAIALDNAMPGIFGNLELSDTDSDELYEHCRSLRDKFTLDLYKSPFYIAKDSL